ncbi:hypothetical protein P43SY_001895 [Pythium insidiosum]|uniref:Uncharacterized protein n=1 Tax=Pythium insidiosum TaxID=114742 RepID=A0AAD5LUQ6_PYTIN|nr:hypothetical protein P43SY_001895 [Pythium insidiosum]
MNMSARVTPTSHSQSATRGPSLSHFDKAPPRHAGRRLLCGLHCAYNWALWLLLSGLIFAQALGAVWNSVSYDQRLLYGRSPLDGPSAIAGFNDEPYSDRSLVCLQQGRFYRPHQLSVALASPSAQLVERQAVTLVNGYRVCSRHGLLLEPSTYDHYAGVCDTLALTLDGVIAACERLGYNVTRDALRVVDGVDSDDIWLLRDSLPVVIMPYWDNALFGRYAIPGQDGGACVFRLAGRYDNPALGFAYLRGLTRSTREAKTVEWLRLPGGRWRHGWYEDPVLRMRWYSDVLSSDQRGPYGIAQRQFDTLAGGVEMDCVGSTVCDGVPYREHWGVQLFVEETIRWFNSVAVANGRRFGLFLYETSQRRTVTSVYSLELFISNFSLGCLLFRWMLCQIVLLRASRAGHTRLSETSSELETIGVACLSSARYFHLLPLLLVPRLKMSLAAFWTVGCQFEGEQKPLSEAWFVVYPAIAECLLLGFSLLNLLAKLLRRRVSDVLFGPTLLFFVLLHYRRFALAQSGWLEIDGRISTVVTAREFEAAPLLSLFTTDLAFRLNGRVTSLFALKMAVLALNLLPLLVSESTSPRRRQASRQDPPLCSVEKALAIRVSQSAGLGRTGGAAGLGRTGGAYERLELTPAGAAVAVVRPYELARVGYVVIGDALLLSVGHWFWFMVSAPLRLVRPVVHLRVVAFSIRESHAAADARAAVFSIPDRPQRRLGLYKQSQPASQTPAHLFMPSLVARCWASPLGVGLVLVYHWGVWLLLVTLLFTQMLGAVWNTVTLTEDVVYGQTPLKGLYNIPGLNDEPFTDRLVVCQRQGRLYRPVQLLSALRQAKGNVVDSTGTTVNGYRVLSRDKTPLLASTQERYNQACDALAMTLDKILAACRVLGYNVTARDSLRILDGLESATTLELRRTLPVLIQPYWDNALIGRYAVPSEDGSACVFRLEGLFDSADATFAYMRAVSKATRESKTAEWLGLPGGTWRNGWYEVEAPGRGLTRWYSDVISSDQATPLGIAERQFDVLADAESGSVEMDCRLPGVRVCGQQGNEVRWGTKMLVHARGDRDLSVAIADGHRLGLFIYAATQVTVVTSIYGLEAVISNISVVLLLGHWLVALVAMRRTRERAIGVGCLANARSFLVLPIVLLPRFKTTFAAYWTLGCQFEGEQMGLSNAWFVIYPAIAEVLLGLFSVLNLLAKLLRRRVSDALFGPTLLFLVLLHYMRLELAQSGWLEFDGRVTTVVTSDEFDAMRLVDFVRTPAALRLNGNIKSLFGIKLALLIGNLLLPLWLGAESTSPTRAHDASTEDRPLRVEQALASRVATSGGIGRKQMYRSNAALGLGLAAVVPTISNSDSGSAAAPPPAVVTAYELTRLGYIVVGGRMLLSINDWFWFVLAAPLRIVLPTVRVRLLVVFLEAPSAGKRGGLLTGARPEFCLVSDPRLRDVGAGDVSALDFA